MATQPSYFYLIFPLQIQISYDMPREEMSVIDLPDYGVIRISHPIVDRMLNRMAATRWLQKEEQQTSSVEYWSHDVHWSNDQGILEEPFAVDFRTGQRVSELLDNNEPAIVTGDVFGEVHRVQSTLEMTRVYHDGVEWDAFFADHTARSDSARIKIDLWQEIKGLLLPRRKSQSSNEGEVPCTD